MFSLVRPPDDTVAPWQRSRQTRSKIEVTRCYPDAWWSRHQ